MGLDLETNVKAILKTTSAKISELSLKSFKIFGEIFITIFAQELGSELP